MAHRLAWLYETGRWPADIIDHRDGNPANNAFRNLRESDQTLNNANMRRKVNNTSGFKGVSRDRGGKWAAYIKTHGKSRRIGTYSTPEEAHAAYMAAAAEAFGAFARAR